jgi:hypothetical protein
MSQDFLWIIFFLLTLIVFLLVLFQFPCLWYAEWVDAQMPNIHPRNRGGPRSPRVYRRFYPTSTAFQRAGTELPMARHERLKSECRSLPPPDGTGEDGDVRISLREVETPSGVDRYG